METSFKAKLVYVALGIAISASCIYYMVEPINRKAITTMKEQLEDPQRKFGPFDEAMSRSLKSMGVEHTVKSQWNAPSSSMPGNVVSD